MEKQFWLDKWQRADTKFNQAQANPLLVKYFEKLNLPHEARVFVPLCGKSIDMIWLSERYQVVGIELSEMACEDFFKENQMAYTQSSTGSLKQYQSDRITLYSGDIFELDKNILGTVQAVYDRAALIALPAELRQRYIKHVLTLLDQDAQILLITSSYNQAEMVGPPFSVTEAEVNELFYESATIHKLCDQEALKIPEHLKAKGLTKAREQVYQIIKT